MEEREWKDQKQLIGGRYRVRRELGRGGTSRVYEVKDQKLGCLRAAKVLDPADEGAEESFLKEGALLASLDHPSIPGVTDMGEDQGKLCLIMDLVEGRTLAKVLEERGRLTVPEVLDLGLQLTEILSYLHDQGLVYRDLKPSNLILGPEGRLYLIDFGACRRFGPFRDKDTRLLGTEGYAAPEQYDPEAGTGPRTDLYGLGVLLYVLLTGRSPETAFLPLDPVPGAGPALTDLLAACLAEDPDRRPEDARAVRAVLSGETAKRKGKRRDREVGRVLVLLGLFLLAGGLWLVLTAAAPLPEARVLGILPPGDRYEDDPPFYLSVLTEGEETGIVFSTDTPGVIDLEEETGLVTPLSPGTAHVIVSLGGTRAEIRFRILETELPSEEPVPEEGSGREEEEAPFRTGEEKTESGPLEAEEALPAREPDAGLPAEASPEETRVPAERERPREEEGGRNDEEGPEQGDAEEEKPAEEENAGEEEADAGGGAGEKTEETETAGAEGETAFSLPPPQAPPGKEAEGPDGQEKAADRGTGRRLAGALLLAGGLILILGGLLLTRRGRGLPDP